MKILAIYAINQHLADLQFEAEQERLIRGVERKPSALRRAFASMKATVAGRVPHPTSATAPAAS